MSIVSNLFRKKLSLEHKKLTALCCFYDGMFDYELANLGITLMGPPEWSTYTWNHSLKHPNMHLISQNELNNYDYDFIIFNHLKQHESYIQKLPRFMHLPGLIVNHEPPYESAYHLKTRLSIYKLPCINTLFDLKVFDPTILYGVQPLPNITKNNNILIFGDFNEEDFKLIHFLKSNIPTLKTLGNNPGIPDNIMPRDHDHYREEIAKAHICICIPKRISVSYECLWAMANKTIVVGLANEILTKVIKKVNNQWNYGILCSRIEEIIPIINQIGNSSFLDPIAEPIGSMFSYDEFKLGWTSLFNTFATKVYYE